MDEWISAERSPTKTGWYMCKGYWLHSKREQEEEAFYCGEWDINNAFVLTHWKPIKGNCYEE